MISSVSDDSMESELMSDREMLMSVVVSLELSPSSLSSGLTWRGGSSLTSFAEVDGESPVRSMISMGELDLMAARWQLVLSLELLL